MTDAPHEELRNISASLDSEAKRWWSRAVWLIVAGFVLSVASVFFEFWERQSPVVILVAAFGAQACELLQRHFSGFAQAVRRRLEFHDSLGWEISATTIADYRARLPEWVLSTASEPDPSPYFASMRPPGTTRLLENVSQSAWYSKHLAGNMAMLCGILGFLGVLLSAVALSVALRMEVPTPIGVSVGRVVTSVLMLLLAVQLIPLAFGYAAFAAASQRITNAAEDMADDKRDSTRAMHLLCEYQVARAVAPLLPEWLWKRERTKLNALWHKYRVKKDTHSASGR